MPKTHKRKGQRNESETAKAKLSLIYNLRQALPEISDEILQRQSKYFEIKIFKKRQIKYENDEIKVMY